MRDKLQKLAELPRLPGHRSNPHRDVTVSGVTVRVHKAKASRTVPVSARLMSLLGDELYQMVSHSETEDGRAGKLAGLLEIDFEDEAQAKSAMMGIVLPLLYQRMSELTADSGPGSLFWYFERILAGNVELSGVRAQSMEDLDEMGFGVPALTRLFWAGLSLALFPTQGAPDTNPGNLAPGPPETSKASETLNISGASAKMTGRPAPTSMTAG